jgi:ADP-heptose:LPS heptosyltransferase
VNQLFISLLRAGDFIMQVPLMRSSMRSGKVSVVVNDEFQQLQELYPEFEFYFFPRNRIQKSINDSSTSLFHPYKILEDFISELKIKTWHKVYNLSHTKISAFLMSNIDAEIKKGLQHNGQNFMPFNNEWMDFFNDRFSDNQRSPYHYLTVLAQSLDLSVPVPQPKEKRESGDILFQCFTSDRKKNWSLDKWSDLYKRFKNSRPGISIKIICSPSEANSLKAFFPESSLLVSSLTDARNYMKSARLVICGDTSFAHLAAETQTPVLMLSLGSSDLTKTSPWQQGAVVMTATTSCSPCLHSSNCPYTVTQCGDFLKVRSVLSAALAQLEERDFISLAEPERVFRMECKLRYGLIPQEISLSRRKDGIIEQNIELL